MSSKKATRQGPSSRVTGSRSPASKNASVGRQGNSTANGLMLAQMASDTNAKGVRTTTGNPRVHLAAELSRAPASGNDGFTRYLREAPFYKHPFIGCKVLNVEMGSTAVSWSGTTWDLTSAITQGDGDNERTGDVIRVIGMDLRMRTSKGSAAAPGSDSEYQIAACYTPLASLAVTQVFQSTGTAYSGCSPADWDYSSVVKRLHHVFSSVDTYHPLRVHQKLIRMNELVNYDGGSTTVATGTIKIVAVSGEDPAAPTQVPLMYGNVQIYYQDV